MPDRIRRSRLLALLLLLLTPGLGGWAVQVLHPCATAGAHAAVAHGTGHHDGGSPAEPGHAPECRCIGSCQSAATVTPASAPTVAAPIPAYQLVSPRPADSHRLPAGRIPDLHPPATAPPLLS
jgi:hypothetical protein